MILRLKRTPGIYLVGFMAAGKTTIGKALADYLGWPYADLDDDIVARAGTSIAEIFETKGEDEFRAIERDMLDKRVRAIQTGRPLVLALGGGAFAQPGVSEYLSGNGVSLWLDCPFETIVRRLGDPSSRPLARDPEKFRALYDERLSVYAKADYRIPIATDDIPETLEQIIALQIF